MPNAHEVQAEIEALRLRLASSRRAAERRSISYRLQVLSQRIAQAH